MSASTVSITPVAAAPRRRPVALGERNQNIMEVKPTNVDKSTGKVKNDAVIERSSQDPVKLDKTKAATGKTPVRRPRKVAKAEKPRWQTIVSVFMKNFVFLAVLIGLGQMVRKLGSQPETLTEFSDFEGRIVDVESRLKTTARMMQAQVEVIDKKLESEIGGLRKEMNDKIEEKTLNLEHGLNELEFKRDELEKSLSELQLKIGDWLPKEELDKLYEKLVKNGKGNDNELSLDDIKLYAKEVMKNEIEKHSADGLGRVDYAVATGGGTVIKHSEPFCNQVVDRLLTGISGVHKDAHKMLEPSFGEPGQCFPLKGSSGFVQVKLRTAILPEAFTIEHVAKSVAYDRSSAPNHCRISGWLQGHDSDIKRYFLTEFSYDLEKSNAQTFNVLDSVNTGLIDTVRLDFLSNHGASHTCIYRLRVHGREPESVSMMAMQP